MSRRRKRGLRPQPGQIRPVTQVDDYDSARQLAAAGHQDQAAAAYERLLMAATEPARKALILNDLAVLAFLRGDRDVAVDRLQQAMVLHPAGRLSRGNLELIQSHADKPQVAAQVDQPHPKANQIKVAVLSFLFNWPSTGGGIVHTVELADSLDKAGFEVVHFFARFHPWEIGRLQCPLPFAHQALEFDERNWNLAEIQKRFRQSVQAFDPDHVIITDSWNMKPLLAEAVRDFPYILRLQALECLCPLNNVRLLPGESAGFRQCALHQLAVPKQCADCITTNGAWSGLLHRQERALAGVGTPEYTEKLLRAFREAEAVLVVNPLTEAMIGPYARSVRVVTSGMDRRRFPDAAELEAKPDQPFTLFFAGLVDEAMKGFHVLQEACALLWEERKNFQLLATGDPPGRMNDFTQLVGWQTQEELPKHLRRADVVVIPTVAQEALGRTAVEAMAAGRPVIASRLGGLPFTVLDGATGLLCEPGDAADLARKIKLLWDDPELRERMGKAGRRRLDDRYSWEVIVERHYRPLLKRRDRTSSAFTPAIPARVDQVQLLQAISEFLRLELAQVEELVRRYLFFHQSQDYTRRFGELKTLCWEEACAIYTIMAAFSPKTVVAISPEDGKSLRRLLDMHKLLVPHGRFVGFTQPDQRILFSPTEAEMSSAELHGKFTPDVLERLQPDLIFLDDHNYRFLHESISETLAWPRPAMLVIHDCGRGLCNPHMTIDRETGKVTSATGVWERHVLAEAFGIPDPLDQRLENLETTAHCLRIFGTPHGLGVIRAKRQLPIRSMPCAN